MKKYVTMNVDQMWFNMQKMDKKQRKTFIKWVKNLNDKNCSFLHLAAKSLFIKMIEESECYFNGLGYNTPVKELQ